MLIGNRYRRNERLFFVKQSEDERNAFLECLNHPLFDFAVETDFSRKQLFI